MKTPRDPMRAAQANMRPPAIRRFYKAVEVREAEGGGFALRLDGRAARTPGRNTLAAKSPALMQPRRRRNGSGSGQLSTPRTCR